MIHRFWDQNGVAPETYIEMLRYDTINLMRMEDEEDAIHRPQGDL